jgi:hypothetical protein
MTDVMPVLQLYVRYEDHLQGSVGVLFWRVVEIAQGG